MLSPKSGWNHLGFDVMGQSPENGYKLKIWIIRTLTSMLSPKSGENNLRFDIKGHSAKSIVRKVSII